jgi:hypothetical protein
VWLKEIGRNKMVTQEELEKYKASEIKKWGCLKDVKIEKRYDLGLADNLIWTINDLCQQYNVTPSDIYLNRDDYDGLSYDEITISLYRPKTDDEHIADIEKLKASKLQQKEETKKRKEKTEENERKEYERLKAKYEG